MAQATYPGLYRLGAVVKAHGIKGGFLADIAIPEFDLESMNVIYIRYPEKQWIPYRIEEIRFHQSRDRKLFFVKLEGIDSRMEAEALRNHEIMTDKEAELTKELTSVVGFQVKRSDNSILGMITDTLETPAYSVLVVVAGKKKILIPCIDEFVTNISKKSRQITVKNTSDLESLE
ncbi:MAG: ribosome maturation factor RimM [Balneolales bacterium]